MFSPKRQNRDAECYGIFERARESKVAVEEYHFISKRIFYPSLLRCCSIIVIICSRRPSTRLRPPAPAHGLPERKAPLFLSQFIRPRRSISQPESQPRPRQALPRCQTYYVRGCVKSGVHFSTPATRVARRKPIPSSHGGRR